MVHHSPTLTKKALEQLDLDGLGLELSPYFDPFLLKSDYNVMYTDYIGTEDIEAKAAENPGYTGTPIPHVDFVWTPGRPLAECSPADVRFDYAVASHVMEHVPDPIGWLNEVLSLLKVGGRLALFLPDRRRSTDYFRRETQFYQLLQWWMEQPPVPTPGQILDFMTHSFVMLLDSDVDWTKPLDPDELPRAYSNEDALRTSLFSHRYGNYLDVHCTVWNALTIKDLLQQVVSTGILNVSIGEVSPDGFEFLLVLTKLGEPEIRPPAKLPSPPFPAVVSSDEIFDAVGEAAQVSRSFSGLEHQLGVVRHDLNFLVHLIDDNSTEIKRLIHNSGRRPGLIRRGRDWLKRHL